MAAPLTRSHRTGIAFFMTSKPHFGRRIQIKFIAACLGVAIVGLTGARAAIPPAERILPPETLFVVTAPDWVKLHEIYRAAPQNQLWDDPAMKPFRDKFMAKWNEEIVKPLERDLGVKFSDYSALLQGQLTLAVLQDAWQGKSEDDGVPGIVLLVDSKDKSDLLKTNLATLRQKWSAAGKPIKTEKVRDVEFAIVTLTTNDVPPTIRRLLPQPQEIEELGDEEKKSTPTQLVVGQHQSLLIVSSSLKAAEQVVVRLTGTGAPTLAESAEFETCQRTLFRDAPMFGWFNAKLVIDLALKAIVAAQNPDAPSPLPMPDFERIFTATGLSGIKSVAFDFRQTSAGALIEFFLSAPESSRTGLLKLLALESKEAMPPAFVPATALKFTRVRLDGRKAIATLEKMIEQISPEGVSTWNFLLNNANEAARLDDPDYDIRKNIFENLGDDIISYEKPPREKNLAALAAAPTLTLVASPNPEKLAASLKGVFVIMSPQGGSPKTRELLGRTIYSLRLPGQTAAGAPNILHYTASGGYVAFSTDEGMIEEYLRSADSQAKPLRALTGFAEAVDKVGGAATGWLNYENQTETMRAVVGALSQSLSDTNRNDFSAVLASSFPFAPPQEKLREWVDFSLLPSYDKLAKYYGFTVSAGQSSVSGITFKYFAPTPPELLKQPPAQ